MREHKTRGQARYTQDVHLPGILHAGSCAPKSRAGSCVASISPARGKSPACVSCSPGPRGNRGSAEWRRRCRKKGETGSWCESSRADRTLPPTARSAQTSTS